MPQVGESAWAASCRRSSAHTRLASRRSDVTDGRGAPQLQALCLAQVDDTMQQVRQCSLFAHCDAHALTLMCCKARPAAGAAFRLVAADIGVLQPLKRVWLTLCRLQEIAELHGAAATLVRLTTHMGALQRLHAGAQSGMAVVVTASIHAVHQAWAPSSRRRCWTGWQPCLSPHSASKVSTALFLSPSPPSQVGLDSLVGAQH